MSFNTNTAAASLLKALQFFKMANAYFEDVARGLNSTEYRKFHIAEHTKRIRAVFNDIFNALTPEQAEILRHDLEDSATLDSIFTNAALLTIEGRATLEAYTLQLLETEIQNQSPQS